MILRRWASSSASSGFALAPTIRQILAQRTTRNPNDASDTEITVSGWIKSIRKQKNVSFAVITDGSTPAGLQAVVVKGRGDSVLKSLTNGAAVQLTGKLVASPGAGQSHELLIDQSKHESARVVVLGECDPDKYPIQKKALSTEYLRDNVHLRTRTTHAAAMVRLRDSLSRRINEWFESQGFVYAHTPILTANDAEGGGEAFRLAPIQTHHPASSSTPQTAPPPPADFFSQPAFLTVSHQLHLEALTTAISRTYTLSPCFRAEPSQTGRHLAEFWMLEAEWAFAPGGVGGICDLTEALLKETVGPLLENRDAELEALWEGGDQARRQALESALSTSSPRWRRMTYTDAISHLEKASLTENFVYKPVWGQALQSEHERWLAESLVGGPVFVTDYPAQLKPFYMRVNDVVGGGDGSRETVACFDLLIPHVGELIGGSVREERVDVLKSKMKVAGLLPDSSSGEWGLYEWYLDLRRYGSAPHGGFGMGFERLLGWVGGIDNVRECIPMPRWAGRMLL